jgi:hypothetical protein
MNKFHKYCLKEILEYLDLRPIINLMKLNSKFSSGISNAILKLNKEEIKILSLMIREPNQIIWEGRKFNGKKFNEKYQNQLNFSIVKVKLFSIYMNKKMKYIMTLE